jgi:hypothetical protein
MLNWGHEPHTGDGARIALIDLLTDEPMDARQDNDETCPIDDVTSPIAGEDSREKLEAERDYYKGQLQACLVSACGCAPVNIDDLMQYPRSDQFAEPSLLVVDAIENLRDFYADLSGEVERQRKVIKAQAESFRKLEADGCSCPEVIEHLENGITYGVSVDGIEYVRETGRMRELVEENRKLHRELTRLNEQVMGKRGMPKKIWWPRNEDGKLIKIGKAPGCAEAIAFDRDGCHVDWGDFTEKISYKEIRKGRKGATR